MKNFRLEIVNVPGSPGVTTGSSVAPWPCRGIHGRSAVSVTSPAGATVTTHVPVPTSGVVAGGVIADTSVTVYAPDADVTEIPGAYMTAGVSTQTEKSASCEAPSPLL